MFKIDPIEKRIQLTRGDIACITISPKNKDGSDYTFKNDDVVRFKVFKKKNCNEVLLQKDFLATAGTNEIDIVLTSEDTKIGELINKETDCWYEVELNPNTNSQTIIGYELDEDQNPTPRIFTLLPEGGIKND